MRNFINSAEPYIGRGICSFEELSNQQQSNLLESAIDDLDTGDKFSIIDDMEDRKLLDLLIKSFLSESNIDDLCSYLKLNRKYLERKLKQSSLSCKLVDIYDDVFSSSFNGKF